MGWRRANRPLHFGISIYLNHPCKIYCVRLIAEPQNDISFVVRCFVVQHAEGLCVCSAVRHPIFTKFAFPESRTTAASPTDFAFNFCI